MKNKKTEFSSYQEETNYRLEEQAIIAEKNKNNELASFFRKQKTNGRFRNIQKRN
jgi:hypothetical protein